MYVYDFLNKISIWTNIWPENCWCGFRQGTCACTSVWVMRQCPFLQVSDQDPHVRAIPTWEQAMAVLCSCLAVTAAGDRGVCCSVACHMNPNYCDTSRLAAIDHRIVCSSPQRCHGLRGRTASLICLLGVSRVAAVLWRGLFIFRCGRWQCWCVCVCVCQPRRLSHSPPSAQGQWHFPFPGGVRCPSPQDISPACTLHFFVFFTEKPERWWQQDQLSL